LFSAGRNPKTFDAIYTTRESTADVIVIKISCLVLIVFAVVFMP